MNLNQTGASRALARTGALAAAALFVGLPSLSPTPRVADVARKVQRNNPLAVSRQPLDPLHDKEPCPSAS